MSTATFEQTASLGLPTPADRPTADVLLFDGHCRFCLAAVRRLRALDTRGQLAFLSLHEPEVAERYPDLTHEQLMTDMYLVDQSGRRHAGVEAYRHMSLHMPWLWPLAPILWLPFSLPLWKFLYRQVAKRRYLIFGKGQSCDNGACRIG
ncbi:MAG: DUF393 domain-containing protein [Planctomycetaceae bacterium]|nr:DUF393 domain-containing protein [Planctomycetaceae bacterium]